MLITNNLNIGYAGEAFLEDLSISLDSKKGVRLALVGENGSGKSTLLKTIANIIEPQSGSISSSGESIYYLSQHISFPKEKMVGEILEESLEYDWEYYKVEKALSDVELDEEIILRDPNTLSGGEKLRVKLAEILIKEPTILLLDEATNHLDINGLNWLTRFLKNLDGSFILVTHNRSILRNSVNKIWEIDKYTKNINFYNGNYDVWRKEKSEKRFRDVKRRNQIQVKVNGIKSWLRANEMHPKYQFSSIVMSRKKALKKLEEELERCFVPPDTNIVLRNKEEGSLKREVLLNFDVEIASLFGRKIGKIRRGDRVRISGKNGSGKTTLLNILAGENESFKGTVRQKEKLKTSFLRQHSSLNPESSVEKIINKSLQLSDTEYHRLLVHFNLKDLKNAQISTLSGGEKKRVEMAILTHQKSDIILLDEPTNHLDIYTQEELENFLSKQNKAIIYVSHDEHLIENLGHDLEINLDD